MNSSSAVTNPLRLLGLALLGSNLPAELCCSVPAPVSSLGRGGVELMLILSNDTCLLLLLAVVVLDGEVVTGESSYTGTLPRPKGDNRARPDLLYGR